MDLAVFAKMEGVEPLPEGIEAGDLTVRRWTAGEGAALHRAVVASVEHLRPWMPWIRVEPQTETERELLIAGWQQDWLGGGDVVFGIWRDGAVVGGSGLHRRIGDGGLEIGYWVHADHVGQGIATDTARAVTELALNVPGIHRVEIHHDVANVASSRIPEKLGYVFVGDVVAHRDEVAPAESGVDRVWRKTLDP